jgi:predicted permease
MIGRDLRYAVRTMARDRIFTGTALVTLVICLGAFTAVFSIVRSVILKPLPFAESDRVVLLSNIYPKAGYATLGPGEAASSVPDYLDRKREMTVFEDAALYMRANATLGVEADARRLMALRVTPSFFRLLRAQPRLGGVFADGAGQNNDAQAILSYGLWQRRFGGDSTIIGRDIRVDGRPCRVVGIMPPQFAFVWSSVDLWLPLAFAAEDSSVDARPRNNWVMIARLRPGATIAQAQIEVNALNARNDQRFPQFATILRDAGFRTVVSRLQDVVVRDVRSTLWLLLGGVLVVFMAGGANVATLVLVRTAGRSQELAVRRALGATVTTLTRQLILEMSVLAAVGGVVGAVLGWGLLHSMTAVRIDLLPRGDAIGFDWQVAAMTFAFAVLAGLLTGLMPVALLWRNEVRDSLREGGRGGTAAPGTSRLHRALSIVQVALAFVLLNGAVLLLVSFRAALTSDPGFQPKGVMTASVNLPASRYGTDAMQVDAAARILERVRAIPGVVSAGLTETIPLGGMYSSAVVLAEGYVPRPGESLVSPNSIAASDGYFEAMRIPLISGRYLDIRDTPTSQPVVVVDQLLAERFWPHQNALGRRLYQPTNVKDPLAVSADTRFLTVVGVVKTIQLKQLSARGASIGAYYVPFSQSSPSQSPDATLTLAVRGVGNAEALTAGLRQAVASVDPQLPLFDALTMEQRIDESLVPQRVPVLIALAFGLIALFLATIGIYGVLAYSVAQRRREIGVRLALGSTPGRAFMLVFRDGAVIALIGLVIGVAGAVASGQVMRGLVYGVQPWEERSVTLVVTAILAGVTLCATYLPARRAAKVSPMEVLAE